MLNLVSLFDPSHSAKSSSECWQLIDEHYAVEELTAINELKKYWQTLLRQGIVDEQLISQKTTLCIHRLRAIPSQQPLDDLLQEYQLASDEGLVLMSLAEALLRIPDRTTAEQLIQEKLTQADWLQHFNDQANFWVNASTLGLFVSGECLSSETDQGLLQRIGRQLMSRLGAPAIYHVMCKMMTRLGNHFVAGQTLDEALAVRSAQRCQGMDYSFDMLGEAALTAKDAQAYFDAYQQAIVDLSPVIDREEGMRPSISIKLSALSPRYEPLKKERVMSELLPRLQALLALAIEHDVPLTFDAEEMDRLDLSLQLFEACLRQSAESGWSQLGLAVQAYSKRAMAILVWLDALSCELKTRVPVRLVKGAYWDSEIKKSQQRGESHYSVFTVKAASDLSYYCCAHFLLSSQYLKPQFATHNALTVQTVLALAESCQCSWSEFEFQRLQGMGEPLYEQLMRELPFQLRIYAPVGSHKQLLPYLVRRLLENGANNAFVQQLLNNAIDVEALAQSPMVLLPDNVPVLALPSAMFGEQRCNSSGINIANAIEREHLQQAMFPWFNHQWQAASWVDGEWQKDGFPLACFDPAKADCRVGTRYDASVELIDKALLSARHALPAWSHCSVKSRAEVINHFADLLEGHRAELITLCQRESGKTVGDAIDEVREAVDFCRYYASQAESLMEEPRTLPGPTGELNQLWLKARGVAVCVSPWNFPLAIFVGQLSAALVVGNTVIAKPSCKTSLIAARTVELIIEAGLPRDVIQLLVCSGDLANRLWSSNIDVVAFTGSYATAKSINSQLAEKPGPIIPFIAETGGQNAMIVDSTALPEQVVHDVLESAFKSAGQRCSALRVLFMQDDIADTLLELLLGAMRDLVVGYPCDWQTDIGPLIDERAKQDVLNHISSFRISERIVAESYLDEQLQGSFVAPVVVSIASMDQLTDEVFGPVLHVVRFSSGDVSDVLSQINRSGYGLTLSIHSRRFDWAQELAAQLMVGNVYINRNQIGAVVGVQPFGGMANSGTGPKAGGPHYLYRFVAEQTVTTNTAAMGGDAALLSKNLTTF